MPSVVFMDEPTSGLDGAATLELARCLKELQRAGLTIVCVIHQPRVSVFKAFSHVLLLGKGGKQVFCGRTENMKPYLTGLGFWFPPDENVADWMIDVVCGLEPRYKKIESQDVRPDKSQEDEEFVAPTTLFEIWDKEYKADCKGLESKWMAGSPLNNSGREIKALEPRQTPGCFSQFNTLLRRVYRQHSNQSFATTIAAIYFAFYGMYGIFPAADYSYLGIEAVGHSHALFCMIMGLIVQNSIFGSEILIYYRECKTGISATSYWAAKVLYSLFSV